MHAPTLLAGLLAFAAPLAHAAGTDDGAIAPPTMQWQVQELVVERQVAPTYPDGVGPTAEPVSCVAAVRIGGDGVPLSIQVSDCPDAFAVQTHRALSAWRWSSWSSVAERRVTLRIRFPTQAVARTAPVAPTAPPVRVPSAGETASVARPAPVAPSYQAPSTTASDAPERQTAITCSGTIKRNRRGEARGVDVDTCPPAFVDAAEQAMRELGKQAAPAAEPRMTGLRAQPVQVTFRLGGV